MKQDKMIALQAWAPPEGNSEWDDSESQPADLGLSKDGQEVGIRKFVTLLPSQNFSNFSNAYNSNFGAFGGAIALATWT